MRTLSEWESKLRLGPGLPRPREALAGSVEEAVEAARALGGPLVMKASGLAHKTEAGAVRVGVLQDSVAEAWAALAPLGDGSVLLAEEVRGELELSCGGLRDSQFGPVLSVGLGGTAAEVFQDAVFMLSPYPAAELERALARLRGVSLLDGYRGQPPLDRSGLAAILDAISKLLEDETVMEVDCNPVIVRAGQPLVADALVVLAR